MADVGAMDSERRGDEAPREGNEDGTTKRTQTPVVAESDEDGLLATERVDSSALASLFTERSDASDELPEHPQPDEAVGDERPATTEEGEEEEEEKPEEQSEDLPPVSNEETMVIASGQLSSEAPPVEESAGAVKSIEPLLVQPQSRIASPLIADSVPQEEPPRPSVPARPPRPATLTVSPAQPLVVPAAVPPLQLLTFDVGGKLFRCKASLIHKYPTKRLYHVVTCGCERIDHATFFIDRNPQHFELVLDWYRTGKIVQPLPPHVNEAALRDDAKYFDLYDEMFPPAPQNRPPRDKTPVLPRLPDRPVRPVVSPPFPLTEKPMTHDQMRFSKRVVRLVTTADNVSPWFCVQEHEHLVVESVKGRGKLLVRVTDGTGMARVFVDQAVLFDSRSWFYLDDDGRAKLQHCVLPGHHVYSFWMEPIGTDPPSPPPPTQPKANAPTKGKSPATAVVPPPVAPTKPELEVVFRVVSTFSCADEMENNGDLVALLQSKGKGWGDESAAPLSESGNSGPQCLFLPPQHTPAPVALIAKLPDVEIPTEVDERDAIVEQIRALAAKDRMQKPAAVQDPPEIKSTSSNPLKRSGAAIAKGSGQEKVTVYQPMPPAAATPRSPAKPAPSTYTTQQPRYFRPRG